jgi:hypothetical protein
VLPISSTHPKILQLRLRTGEILHSKFDTAEATSAWHAGFVSALFTFKTHHSKKIKIMIPLRRIRKIHRDTFENIARVMSVDVDCAPSSRDIVDNDIIEGKFTLEDFERTRIQLSYFLNCGNFDDLILDAIVRAKLEVSQAEPLANHRTPPPLLKITSSQNNEEGSEDDEKLSDHVGNSHSSENALADKFVKAFGLEANTKLPSEFNHPYSGLSAKEKTTNLPYICGIIVYPCLLLRTLPSPGHIAISKDYLCEYHSHLLTFL